MDIVVVGGGASGLLSAIFAKNEYNNVTILERYNKCGKKILVTGNGRCNYFNEIFDNDKFNSSNNDFIEEFNTDDNRKKVLDFFDSIGIVPTIKNDYYYPLSKEASSIRNILLNEVNKKKINVINNADVLSVKKINNKFIINYSDKSILCDKVILATGSNAYYSDETNGYSICKSFGHHIVKVVPSLVQLIGEGKYFKDWSGSRNNSKVSIYVDDKFIKSEIGEVMFTDYGLSGICIFNISGIATRAINQGKKVEITINLLNDINNLDIFLDERYKKIGDKKIEEFLEGLIPYKLVNAILKEKKLESRFYSSLNDKEKKVLVDSLNNYKVLITGSKSFKDAQVCSGGVDTKEIDSKTFESKLVKNLYIVGELLDVDGICGGYNLGFAWISGIIAGSSAR